MKVPAEYYIRFWIVNTGMMLGTGIVLGIMSKILIVTIPVALVLGYQVFIFSYYRGKRRGAFEYSYFERSEMKKSSNKELVKLFKEAKSEYKFGDPKSANRKLKIAAGKSSENFVANFKYAMSCERLGKGQEATLYYINALGCLANKQKKLQKYTIEQIRRIEKKGPSNKAHAPGLQYIIY